MNPEQTCDAINKVTRKLMESGLADAQNFSRVEHKGSHINVIYKDYYDVSQALRDTSYKEMYDHLDVNRQYSIKLLDGGLIHFKYKFQGNGQLLKHTLAYFPAPNFEPYQNEPELYIDEGNFYVEVISKNILPVPMRFDFAPDEAEEMVHPASHMTLGQYKNCRIPLAGPLCPVSFMNFILRSFYNTAFLSIDISQAQYIHNRTIFPTEERLLHFNVL